MSSLAKKLLEAAHNSDGFKAWALAPIAAEYIQELEAQRDELLEALEELVAMCGGLVSGEYPPDGFTTQPARDAIAKATGVLAEGDSTGVLVKDDSKGE